MKALRSFVVVLIVGASFPVPARAQALTNLASVRVGYNTRKNTVKPQGELKAQIDALDQQIAAATRLGNTGELRRLFARGTALLAGRAWTDELDYATSLVLRTDRVVVDSSKPYSVRIEQIYRPSIALDRALTARAVLRTRPPAAAQGTTTAAPPAAPVVVKALGTFDGVGRDLRESPFPLDLKVSGVANGPYTLGVELLDNGKPIGETTLAVVLHDGLDDAIARLERDAPAASAKARADILFPVDRIRNVNRGRVALGALDVAREIAGAQAIAASRDADPLAAKPGDVKRHYLLEPAAEIMPYRLYVPKAYTAGKPAPLVVALHGLGGTEDSFFDGYNRAMPALAEKHGFIVVAPLGYRVDGSYGWGVGAPPQDPATKRMQELSEQDVMQVVDRVRQLYTIDRSRIYLMGHSMGAIGTWKIAAKYPDVWAALGPIAGTGAPATVERFAGIPEIVVHGDADPTVSVEGSRGMVGAMRKLGTEVKYVEVPGGGHSDVAAPSLPAIFDFFDAHRKRGS